MIPGLLASEVSAALKDFIITGYETDTPPFAGEFERLVEEYQDGEGFIKGPYISLGLPFIKGTQTREWFSGFQTDFPPFSHQEAAWQRLASDREAANTLVATGTGSGKTECFLYPVLDHCQRHRDKGIKAIIIYPMNALATDQARRFAKTIDRQAGLKGLRVGLFVGGAESSPQKTMDKDAVITCKETLRREPPDILLTNYKMLDYLLMRPKDQSLWAHNGPDTLRYLIVDELHTFDGAQGTDLSLLIRRLQARFKIQPGQLICAGTSATLGGDEAKADLLKYASTIFSSTFDEKAIIAEQRQTEQSFIEVLQYLSLHPGITPEQLRQALATSLDSWLDLSYELFFCQPPKLDLSSKEGRSQLGRELKAHGQVSNLLRQMTALGRTPRLADLARAFIAQAPASFEHQVDQLVLSLLGLLAHARDDQGQPLVQLRVQLWSRELRRIVGALAQVGEEPGERPLLSFGDDPLRDEDQRLRLPLVQCRECHGTAWLSRMEASAVVGQQLESDLQLIYSAFFSSHADTAFLIPAGLSSEPLRMGVPFKVCRQCGTTMNPDHQGDCPGCKASVQQAVDLVRYRQIKEVQRGELIRQEQSHDCPYCRAKNALIVFGARASSLSAVAIHRLYASRDNNDKKLITFSDSVQDATHRAGFFSARTWHNNLRMALAQLMHSAPDEAPIKLTALPAHFQRYWLQTPDNPQGRFSLDRYLKEFIPPELRYRSDFELFEKTGKLDQPQALLELIGKRVLWEALEDTTWRSQVGRSLNRVGLVALTWSEEPLEGAASAWVEQVHNQWGLKTTLEQAQGFFAGLLVKMLHKGAVDLEFLSEYQQAGGKSFLLYRLPFTPQVGPSSGRPRYPAEASSEGMEALVSKSGSWYVNWLESSLTPDFELRDRQQLQGILVSALDVLAAAGLLVSKTTDQGKRFWALHGDALYLTPGLKALVAKGYRSLHLPADQAQHWVGRPLISAVGPDCCYEQVQDVRPSVFRELYLRGDIFRVIAHEHTGLLGSDERKQVEESFIQGQGPWEYNLLSATPTLEMGIDIGDLSSVLLCSVPPAQANYLQRVGRGGRKDGNSFVFTLANGRPHDLVFYADPSRMLDTPVEAPAVFLKARHVLRRQLLAFAMDDWTATHSGQNLLPARMQPVLDAVKTRQEQNFPFTLLKHLRENRQRIWEAFVDYIAVELNEADQEALREYLFGGGDQDIEPLQVYVIEQLKQVADERDRIVEQIDQVKKQIERLSRLPDDESRQQQLLELEQERAGYQRLRLRLHERETLNFFTDEGLLPNYAFPEEGATLHSIIFRHEKKGGTVNAESELVRREYEYQRPAQAALSELAPESYFYAGNRKVQVTRVETAKGRNIQEWRFCPRCHYSAARSDLNAGFNAPACPRCHSPLWADSAAKTHLLKMTQVYAFSNARDTLLDDHSDDREPVFFNRQLLIDFDPSEVLITWVLEDEDRPFGFEFIRQAQFMEVNFGRRDKEGDEFDVAGQTLIRSGFTICKSCGSVQDARKKEPQHLKSCNYHPDSRQRRASPEDDGIINCLYLYRQFHSEAVRILLPRLSTGGTEEQINSFVAALQLGLKRKFGGKVDHLRVAHQSEPLGDSDERRHYLVLYDSVPGGTGYLHDLLSEGEQMQAVFQLAQDTLAACDCYDHTMDGCYRCLLEYRNSYGMESTKKSVAQEMLKDILDQDRAWEKTEKRLSDLKSTPWVDSELEARFPKALAAFSGHSQVQGQKVKVVADVLRGKRGHHVRIGEQRYEMEPHVQLGQAQGVRFACEPDFVLWPQQKQQAAIAIFLDGYEYHQGIVQQDLLKRQSLMHAGFVVWSLTWYDINLALGDKAQEVPIPLSCIHSEHHQVAVGQLAASQGITDLSDFCQAPNLAALMRYLAQPSDAKWSLHAWLMALQCLPATQLGDAALRAKIEQGLLGLPADFTDRKPSQVQLAGQQQLTSATEPPVEISLLASGAAISHARLNESWVTLKIEMPANTATPEARQGWQTFWMLVNRLQFLPHFYAYTPESIQTGVAATLSWPDWTSGLIQPEASFSAHNSNGPEPAGLSSSSEAEWFFSEQELELLDEDLAAALRAGNWSWPEKPEVGIDIENEQGEMLGCVELAFDALKLALIDDLDSHEAQQIQAAGWTLVTSLEALQEELTA